MEGKLSWCRLADFCAMLLTAAALMLLAQCSSTPATRPVIEPSGQITNINLPADCGPVQIKITMWQGTSAHAEGGGGIFKGTSQMPDLTNFDLGKSVNIDVEVVVGNCPPFVRGAAWHFEGILEALGSGKYSADFSDPKKFQRTH